VRKKKHDSLLSLSLVVYLSTFLMPATASVIVANTDAERLAQNSWGPANHIGAGFTSPSTATSLVTVDLLLSVFGGGTASAELNLHSNGGGRPGTLLANLGTAVVSAAFPNPAYYSFASAGPVSLLASTQYFLVLHCSDCTLNVKELFWGGGSSPIVSGLPGANVNQGNWVSGDSGGNWAGLMGRTPAFTVNGEVPESSTLWLTGVALGLLKLKLTYRRGLRRAVWPAGRG